MISNQLTPLSQAQGSLQSSYYMKVSYQEGRRMKLEVFLHDIHDHFEINVFYSFIPDKNKHFQRNLHARHMG